MIIRFFDINGDGIIDAASTTNGDVDSIDCYCHVDIGSPFSWDIEGRDEWPWNLAKLIAGLAYDMQNVNL